MKKKKGQAILELALVLPILLFIFCGIADFGRILYASARLNLISQEAVRMAGIGKSDSEIRQYVISSSSTNSNNIKTSISPEGAYRRSGDYVTVKITYSVTYITPLMNKILPSPLEINNKSTIRVE